MLSEVKEAAGQIVMFIDELHTIVGAGAAEGAVDARTCSSRCSRAASCGPSAPPRSTSTASTSRRDPALERRFQPVMVGEPTVEDTIAILRGLKERYEVHMACASRTAP